MPSLADIKKLAEAKGLQQAGPETVGAHCRDQPDLMLFKRERPDEKDGKHMVGFRGGEDGGKMWMGRFVEAHEKAGGKQWKEAPIPRTEKVGELMDNVRRHNTAGATQWKWASKF